MKKSDKLFAEIKDFVEAHKGEFPMNSSHAFKHYGIGYYKLRILSLYGYIFGAFDGLSVRAANCLSNAGIKNKEDAANRIRSKKLSPHYTQDGIRNSPRNYGLKTHEEVCKWAGVPFAPKPVREITCPHCNQVIPYSSHLFKKP